MEQKKKGKFIFLSIIIVAILGALAGFYFYDKQITDELETLMIQPAEDYYEKYMSANAGSAAYKVTLEMLIEANKKGENYKLNKLDVCNKKTTYATINIDYYNGAINKTEITLDCKKYLLNKKK